MTLTRSAVSPRFRRYPRLRRLAIASLLVATGVVGQLAVDAMVAIRPGPLASAHDEIRLMLDTFPSRHVGITSCAVALAELRASMGEGEVRDPWERPYAPMCAMDRGHTVVFIVSGGPDRVLGTSDDIVGSQRVLP